MKLTQAQIETGIAHLRAAVANLRKKQSKVPSMQLQELNEAANLEAVIRHLKELRK